MGPKSDDGRPPSGGRPIALLLIGPVPPPAYGVATATDLLAPVARPGRGLPHRALGHQRSAHRGQHGPRRPRQRRACGAARAAAARPARPGAASGGLLHPVPGACRDSPGLGVRAPCCCSAAVRWRIFGAAGMRPCTRMGRAGSSGLMRDVFRRAARILVLGDGLVPMAKAIDASARVGVVPNGCRAVLTPSSTRGQPRSRGPLVSYLGALLVRRVLHDALRVGCRTARRCTRTCAV